jgi:prepilin-type N-terminal cleavage/methylation domain-containing protein
MRRRGFTLIELLVVIAVIALLLGIVLPALGTSRETSRRAKCLANLRGIGQGFGIYLNDYKGIFPPVRPLHDPPVGPNEPQQNDPSLLDLLSEYLAVPVPRRDDDGFFIVTDPYKCPSDTTSSDEASGYEPLWRTDGTSYEYVPGEFMLIAEIALFSRDPAFGVTRAYEKDRPWHILVDADDWHTLRKTGLARNALYFPDMRADWSFIIPPEELGEFFEDVKRFGGTGVP